MEASGKNGLIVTDDKSLLDFDFIHRELADSYWAKNIPKEVVKTAIQNSICFGVFLNHQQIGFARVVTDRATFAYLCDVIITEKFRGQGAGKLLMETIMRYDALQDLRKFALATLDAHELYKKYGFESPSFPERLMEIHRPAIYSGEKGQ